MRTVTIGACSILVLLAAACGRPSPPAAATSAGSAAAPGSAASETVPGLTDYPGANRVAYGRKSDPDDGWSAVTRAEFTSADSFAAVFAHYEAAIAAGGWTVAEVETRTDKAEWKLTREGAIAEVELEAERGIVEVKIVRKDR